MYMYLEELCHVPWSLRDHVHVHSLKSKNHANLVPSVPSVGLRSQRMATAAPSPLEIYASKD